MKDSRASGYAKPENVEAMSKLWELESNMIDLKGAMDRKIATLMEEIPAWMTWELKSMEDKDAFLWKDARSKFS